MKCIGNPVRKAIILVHSLLVVAIYFMQHHQEVTRGGENDKIYLNYFHCFILLEKQTTD